MEDRAPQCSPGYWEQQQVLGRGAGGAARREGNSFQDLNFIPASCEVHAPARLHQLTSDKNAYETAHPAAALLPLLSMKCLAAPPMALHDPCFTQFTLRRSVALPGMPQKGLRSWGNGRIAPTETGFNIFFSSVPCLNFPAAHLKGTEDNICVLVLTGTHLWKSKGAETPTSSWDCGTQSVWLHDASGTQNTALPASLRHEAPCLLSLSPSFSPVPPGWQRQW